MFGERVSIGIPCGRSESSPTLHLIVMMLHVLAQLFAFTRFPFMSGKVSLTKGCGPAPGTSLADSGKMAASLGTSSKSRLRRGLRTSIVLESLPEGFKTAQKSS